MALFFILKKTAVAFGFEMKSPREKMEATCIKQHFPNRGTTHFLLVLRTVLRTGSDLEKHLTMKNCDNIFLKIILRLNIAEKQRHFDAS